MRKTFKDYNQEDLDKQYNNRSRFPDFESHFRWWGKWSAEARSSLPCYLDVAFGPSAAERIDIFPADNARAPIYVFIHGGYWYSLDKSDYSFVADGMRPHGVTTVINNFGLAPATSMDEIVRHNREMLSWVWRNAAQYGGDPDRIYICGHSAGGHLAAMLLATDWPQIQAGLPAGIAKGACSIGGIFDLEPIRQSFLNAKLHLTEQQVLDHSPLKARYPIAAPLALVVAVDESEEFHRQSEEMRQFWEANRFPVKYLVPKNADHFNVVNQLRDPASELVQFQLHHFPW